MNVTSSAARWRAIANRDQSVNSFVYAVRTTGIYCRPACPARLARRANIEFFDSPSQAEKAGYRPCKRCKPELHVLVDPHVAIVQRACEMISASTSSSSQRPTLHELAAEANLTPSHFHRVFKKVVGVTPGQYARGPEGGRKGGKRASKVGRDGSAEGQASPVNNNGLVLDTPSTVVDSSSVVVGDGNVERSTIDWNEFDAMLAGVDSLGGTVSWGDELQVSSLADENIENLDPLHVKGPLSSDTHGPQLNYEDILDSISGNDTSGSIRTELLRGDSYLVPTNTSGDLEQSTAIPISPFLFERSDMFWNEEGFPSYQ